MNRFDIEDNLEKNKKLFKSLASKLPDKGAKIKLKISELEEQLEKLCLKSSTEPKVSVGDSKDILRKTEKTTAESVSKLGTDSTVKDLTDLNSNLSSKQAIDKKETSTKLSCEGETERTVKISPELSTTKSVENMNKNTKKEDNFGKYKSDCLSFADLNKSNTTKSNALENLYDSPGFKTYREHSLIQLTDPKPLFEPTVIHKHQKILYSHNSLSSVASEDTVKKLHHSLSTYPDDAAEEVQPKSVLTELMRHQITALSWLVWRENQQPSGGILADDMGLGKTLSIIAMIMKQKEKKNFMSGKTASTTHGTLIVCMASILHQWKEEILKHCKKDYVNVLLYHGPKREKDIRHIAKFDIVLTTYNIVSNEKKTFEKGKESPLFTLKWERIVLDEAHTIKNHSTQTATSVFMLKGFRKWCVTGTPIHNDLKDIYSLVRFLEFSPFDDYKKWKVLTSDRDQASEDRRNLLVKSILLRRTKNQIDETGKPLIKMVKKSLDICYLELSTEERQVYDRLHEKVREMMSKYLHKQSKSLNTGRNLLVLLLRLQQCCNHVSLLGKDAEEDAPDDSLGELSMGLASLNIKDLSSSSDASSESSINLSLTSFCDNALSCPTVKSTKIRKLLDVLKDISEKSDNTDKSVIVSQWVSMLDIVATHLDMENMSYHMIAGSTKVEERQLSSNDFNYNRHGCKIMLLSLKAGGVGLNLVGANHLFLLDLHWNPALERQACDRIHRVGQNKDVTIHKFVCKGTIEQRILDLQQEKSNIASNVYKGAKNVKKGLSMDDFMTLFNVRL